MGRYSVDGKTWGGPRDSAMRRKMTQLMELAWPGSCVRSIWTAAGAWRTKRAMLDTTSWGGKIRDAGGVIHEFSCWNTMNECAKAGAIEWELNKWKTLSETIECYPVETQIIGRKP